jgi:hypothetical protein
LSRSAIVWLSSAALVVAAVSSDAQPAPKPTPRPTAAAGAKPKEKPRVFTNDDLEAARKKPSNVQDLTATGGEAYTPPERPPAYDETPRTESVQPADARATQIAEAESNVKSLDQQAKEMLWRILQSTDQNEILRLKAEQQEVLNQLEAARADLARLKGEQGSSDPPSDGPPRN